MYRRIPGGKRDIRTIFYYEEAKPSADVQEMYSSGSEASGDDALRSERVTGVRNAYFSYPMYSETHASCIASWSCECIESMYDCTAAVFALLT